MIKSLFKIIVMFAFQNKLLKLKNKYAINIKIVQLKFVTI